VFDKSLEQHAQMCVENAKTLFDAKLLARELEDDISWRMKRYVACLSHCSKNYREWLIDDYKTKLVLLIGKKFREASF
jgi:hypothetical protein